LSKKEDGVLDPNLLGMWYSIDEEKPDKVYYLAILERDEHYMKFIFFGDSTGPTLEMKGYITILDGEKFINIQSINFDLINLECTFTPDSVFTFYHYYISEENELVLSNFDQGFFKAAIDSGLIQGTYDEISVALRDSTRNLIKLVKGRRKEEYLTGTKKGEVLIEPVIYHRMKK
jgi:hypothetical protein